MVTERTIGQRPRRQTRSPARFELEVTRGDSRRGDKPDVIPRAEAAGLAVTHGDLR